MIGTIVTNPRQQTSATTCESYALLGQITARLIAEVVLRYGVHECDANFGCEMECASACDAYFGQQQNVLQQVAAQANICDLEEFVVVCVSFSSTSP